MLRSVPCTEVHAALTRLSTVLSDAKVLQPSLLDRIHSLELHLRSHEPFLKQAAVEAGSSLHALVDALVGEAGPFQHSGGARLHEAAHGAPPTANAPPLPTYQSIESSRHSATFQSVKRLAEAIDSATMDGKMTVLHHGFTIDAPLVKRVLFGGNPIIGRYDELLTQMLHLRTYLPNYLGRAQAIDTITGQVPQRASEWVFGKPDGTFGPNLEKFLRFEFASVDWLADAVKLKNMLYGTNLGWLHAADHYVVVAALELVKDFMHRTIVAAGGPALPANAHDLTVLTFFEFYIEHVKMANCLSTKAEQRSWLTHASQQCTASLRLMGLAFRDHVNSTSSKSTPLVLLSKDSPPYQNLVGRQRSLKTLVEHKEAFGWVRSREHENQEGVLSLDRFPLLSAQKQPTQERPAWPTPPESTLPRTTPPAAAKRSAPEPPSEPSEPSDNESPDEDAVEESDEEPVPSESSDVPACRPTED